MVAPLHDTGGAQRHVRTGETLQYILSLSTCTCQTFPQSKRAAGHARAIDRRMTLPTISATRVCCQKTPKNKNTSSNRLTATLRCDGCTILRRRGPHECHCSTQTKRLWEDEVFRTGCALRSRQARTVGGQRLHEERPSASCRCWCAFLALSRAP